jgi:hypothetical protein
VTDQDDEYLTWREGRVRALVVPPEGPGELRWLDPTLDALQAVLGGGWLEGVGPPGDARTFTGRPVTMTPWHAYCDEEGKLKQLPVNRLATKLALLFGWPLGDVLCGTVMFLGNGADGDEADVPTDIVAVWEQLRTA